MKKHTSHRPGKYADCFLCMAMLAANNGDKDAQEIVRAYFFWADQETAKKG